MPRGSVPTRCVRCGCALVASHINPVPEGMRKHSGRGLCSACHKADMRGVEREPETTGAQFHDQPWAADALCAEIGGDLWFPEKDSTGEPGQSHVREAKAICARCPVRTDCLQWALETDQRYGLWGGVSPRERAKMTPPAATGTDGPSYDATDQAVEHTEQPAPRSYGLAYIGGAHAHRPIPLATDVGIRPAHQPKAPRPTGLDWAKHTAPDQPAAPQLRCRWCRQPATDLADDLCDDCRETAERQFHAPDNTEQPCPPTVSTAPSSSATPAPRSTASTTTAAAAATDAQANPTTKKTGTTTTPTTAPPVTSAPSTTRTASSSASTAARGPDALDVVDHCARLLRDTAASSNPLVQMLRGSALSVLAALDHAHHPQTPAATPAPKVAAGTITEPRPVTRRARRSSSSIDLAKARQLLEQGHTCPQVATELGVNVKRLRHALDQAGIPRPDGRSVNSGGNNRVTAYPDELVAAIRTRYLDHQMTQAEVAADLDITVKVVQNVMTKHDIPARPAVPRNPRSVLTDPADLDELCRRYQAGESGGALAKAYGVSLPTILDRLRGRNVPIRNRGGRRTNTEENQPA